MSQAATAEAEAEAETEMVINADMTEKTSVEPETALDGGHDVTGIVPDPTESAPDVNKEISSTPDSTVELAKTSQDITSEMSHSEENLMGTNEVFTEQEPLTIETDNSVVMPDTAEHDLAEKLTVRKEMYDESGMQVIDGVQFPKEPKEDLGPGIFKHYRGMIVSFSNISYKVQLTRGHFYQQTKSTKDVLTDVSGVMKPGMNAVMGPVGAGKATLLDILAARKEATGLTGEVLVDGVPQPVNFNCIAGYVVHDYMMSGTLTVRENLEFSAALRLPKNISKLERIDRVNNLIEELGLSNIENTRIGTLFTRGLAAGEKKKASIAMELVRDPGVLFLDEPTSGLDTSNSHVVLQLLRRLAKQGKTVIFSIYQPRYSVFKHFDSVTLLTNGKLMYHGPAKHSIDYFKAIGYRFHSHENPVDGILDILCKAAENKTDTDHLHELYPTPETSHCYSSEMKDSGTSAHAIPDRLACVYRASSYFNDLATELEKQSNYSKKFQSSLSHQHITHATSFFHQLKWLGKRIFKKYLADPHIPIFTVTVGTLLCLVLGSVFYRIRNNRVGIHNRTGLLFFIVNCQMYSSISNVELLAAEKKILIHEYISGYYSLPAYFFSKLLFDIIPIKAMPSVIFNSTTYILVGLKRTVPAILISVLSLIMVSYASAALSIAAVAGESTVTIPSLILSLIFILMTIYSGLLVHLQGIVKWLSWLQYFSISRYGITALMVNEFVGLTFTYNVSGMKKGCHCQNPKPVIISCTGIQHLHDIGMGTTPWDLWQNHVGLSALTIFFLSIAYLKLFYMKKFS
ncbi:broad substrate specificity ATP-binding cassette transporter ABCG2-like [Heterodontus francisci]|uniref:broad substrate specificity ATP-binding cassette transporter ABCG2-like n=1 Tax=Heterodontus francisci TaxID=7792 RepID=UPI00355C25AC